jgi:hypothetical protein
MDKRQIEVEINKLFIKHAIRNNRPLPELLYEDLFELIKKVSQIDCRVSGDFGEIIAEIRNKFSPILNYFTLKDEKIQGLISEGMAKKELELILAKDLHSKIKELLDRLG